MLCSLYLTLHFCMQLTNKLIETFFIKRIIYVGFFASVVSAAVDFLATRAISINNMIDLLIVAGLLLAMTFVVVDRVLMAAIVGGLSLAFLMSGEIMLAGYLKPGSTAVILVLGMLASVVLTGVHRVVVHSLLLGSLCTALGYLVLIDTQFPDGSPIISNAFNVLIIYLLLSCISFIIKSRYDESIRQLMAKNNELNEARLEIEKKRNELSRSMEEVSDLNMQLGKMVEDKTLKISRQNDLLIQHAFANAHHIRGPLARILGLARLNTLDRSADRAWLLSKIEEEAVELDLIVKKINGDLNSIIE